MNTKNIDGEINKEKDLNEKKEENLILDFEDYKEKNLENKRLIIESYINDKKINDKIKIIKFLESEFDFLEEQQKAIFYSNEEMEKYSSIEDKDIQECRAENIKIIFKNLERMKKIQEEIKNLDRNHYIKDKDLFSYVNKNEEKEKVEIETENEVDDKDPKKNPLILEFIDRASYNNININHNDNDIIRDIDIDFYNNNYNFIENENKNEEILKEIDL